MQKRGAKLYFKLFHSVMMAPIIARFHPLCLTLSKLAKQKPLKSKLSFFEPWNLFGSQVPSNYYLSQHLTPVGQKEDGLLFGQKEESVLYLTLFVLVLSVSWNFIYSLLHWSLHHCCRFVTITADLPFSSFLGFLLLSSCYIGSHLLFHPFAFFVISLRSTNLRLLWRQDSFCSSPLFSWCFFDIRSYREIILHLVYLHIVFRFHCGTVLTLPSSFPSSWSSTVRRQYRVLLPSNVLAPGAFAAQTSSLDESAVPATENYATPAKKAKVRIAGLVHGCHTCGWRGSKSLWYKFWPWVSPGAYWNGVDFFADHQPPLSDSAHSHPSRLIWRLSSWLSINSLDLPLKRHFLPHCIPCSQKQGSTLAHPRGNTNAIVPHSFWISHCFSLRAILLNTNLLAVITSVVVIYTNNNFKIFDRNGSIGKFWTMLE